MKQVSAQGANVVHVYITQAWRWSCYCHSQWSSQICCCIPIQYDYHAL